MSARATARSAGRPGRRARVVAVLAAAVATLAGATPAVATSPPGSIAAARARAVTYVSQLQGSDGSFASGGGLSNEWAFSALAAAGVAAADLAPAGAPAKNARAVYRAQLSQPDWFGSAPVVTDYERAALNAYAAGIDPARVSAGRNLIAEIAAAWQPSAPGYFGPPSNFNGTVFALLALGGARTTTGAPRVPQWLLGASVDAVRANEHTDGGWDYSQAADDPQALAAPSDIDMTGATMAALCTVGVPRTDPAVKAGEKFLAGKLLAASGAFDSPYGANTDSNAWAVSGLNACGIAAQGHDFTSTAGRTPVDFLLAQQFTPGGGFRYQPGDTSPTPYSSIDALRALAGAGFTAPAPRPVTPGQPRWEGVTGFTPGSPSDLAVAVDGPSGAPGLCSVTVTPTAATVTLGAVVSAAAAHATPAGCGGSGLPGQLPAADGHVVNGSSGWQVSVDGSPSVPATAGQRIRAGDTIALRYVN
ncbi:hypothetical protein [Streptomyces sp. ICBB 8177]|uniref:hypothetical protein n=1 Tax=Streptomyces sp. ICBB 8177 TaxID=563922 RepID=UPI000D67DCED|nr:hypothetical protein [Streptomyces sp. ICBB 8177]PWI42644.1 hypothetical protein CK485_10010 [Streptomyces sp. ICBB 8177]